MIDAFRAFSRGGIELPRTRQRGLSRCPYLGARLIVVGFFFHISASGCPLPPSFIGRNTIVVWSCGQFRPFGAVTLVGFLRRERPPRHKARPYGALPTVGTVVPFGGFFSAGAVCSEIMPDGFPLVSSLPRFAPSGIISNVRHVHTFLDHRGAMGFVGVVLGASHLRHSRRAERSALRTSSIGRTSAPFFFWGVLIGDPPNPPA